MCRQYLLGLDVGTTGCKAVVFNSLGKIIGKTAYREYPVVCNEPLQAEQDGDYVFACLLETMKEAVFSGKTKVIEAVSISVQGDAVMAVDESFHLLSPVILGMDYRCAEQCEQLKLTISEKKVHQKTGQPLHPINMMGKIMWIANEHPVVYKKAFRFITYAEFLMQRLGGEPKIDLTMASRSMGMDLLEKQWFEPLLETMHIDKNKLSEICNTGEILGSLSEDITEQLGLLKRPLLIAGAHDQTVSAVGAGLEKGGMALDASGTAEVLSVCYEEPKINELMRKSYYSCYYHAIPNKFFSFAHMQTGGILLRWYRDNFASEDVREALADGKDPYDYMQRGIGREPAKVLVLPYFNGSGTPLCDIDAKGAVVGLTLATGRQDIYKGILDGLAFELKRNCDGMKQAGIDITEIRAVGGGARSPLWLQTKADITGYSFTTLACEQSGCLGAAVIAAVGAGIYRTFEEAVSQMVRIDKTYEPSAYYGEQYEERYELYLSLYPSLKNINKKLTPEIRNPHTL